MIALQTEFSPAGSTRFRVLRAQHLGMCFGVRDAIDLALQRTEQEPVTVLGDLVHNETVLARLRQSGVRIEHQVGAVATPAVMITAHGASERTMNGARARGLEVVEATCPLVRFAHRAVARLVAQGYHPVIVGQRNHVEVRGITEDLAEYDVILTEEDVARLQERPRFGVAAQTTQPVARVKQLVELIQRRFPQAEVGWVDTVCQPTKQRQRAAVDLARQSDVVVVIGGAHSNNTRELVASCAQHCPRVYHVQTPEDVRAEWFAEAQTVGVTAGTSTPDDVIEAVIRRLEELSGQDHPETAENRCSHEPILDARAG